ncbi:hypothetical protein QBZ16_004959 [Prototheca wickerhamii]|uniref:Uncharacterized protein n=1 Tax=Prototheca wickerhamii TaxID=3111 RepID=A0AAD9MK03_PROWI|nr:hypothetical protein QBZ16_004959 [Prototheca wickerhamii]
MPTIHLASPTFLSQDNAAAKVSSPTASASAPVMTAAAAGHAGRAPAPKPDQKPAHDVGTIHPLDTMKVRMQTSGAAGPAASAGSTRPRGLARGLHEFGTLYKGVFGAATGAGLIIGTYFAFYSTTKKFLRKHTELPDGTVAFASGATAALGSSVVKVPLAVCIRSVQAGVYTNALVAAREIVRAAGPRGLFTGFLPTILEDVPDMAVKFAVYETVRNLHSRLRGRHATTLEDLVIGGVAGAAAAAATTPLDVVKTVMMTSASSRPTVLSATRHVLQEGGGARALFRGVGPRALSNGLNSAVFFCFFEAIRQILIKRQAQRAAAELMGAGTVAAGKGAAVTAGKGAGLSTRLRARWTGAQAGSGRRASAAPAACLTLALPLPR